MILQFNKLVCFGFKKRNQSKASPSKGDEGYTLLELLVVLAILALILGVAAPMIMKQFGAAKSKTAAIQVRALATNLEFFMLDVGRYPSEGEGLKALREKPADAKGWNGPYVSQATNLVDPWGQAYLYKPLADKMAPFEIKSLGSDGKAGGEGEDRDVSSLD